MAASPSRYILKTQDILDKEENLDREFFFLAFIA
jgi:hypothetical protein